MVAPGGTVLPGAVGRIVAEAAVLFRFKGPAVDGGMVFGASVEFGDNDDTGGTGEAVAPGTPVPTGPAVVPLLDGTTVPGAGVLGGVVAGRAVEGGLVAGDFVELFDAGVPPPMAATNSATTVWTKT